jgi:hypothetical protein
MVRKVRELLAAALLAGVVLTAAVKAQTLPPAPIPAIPAGDAQDATAVAQPHTIPTQGATPPAPPPAPLVVPLAPVPPKGPIIGSPPILMPPPPPEPLPQPAPPGHWSDRVNYPPAGWFADFELDVVGPHIKNRLTADVPITSTVSDTVHLPMASLDWTGSPRFELGYRFPNNGGQFTAVYRFLATDGRATISNFDDGLLASLHSRLDFNVLDFAYAGGWFSPEPASDLQWSLGARLAQAFFDSRATDGFREVRTSDHFIGVGPLGALEWWRRLDMPGFSIFGRLEGSVPVGSIHQGYEEIFHLSKVDKIGGATSQRQTQAVPTLSFDLGLGWTPQWSRYSRLSFGYHLERWWELGEVNDSSADLTTQGLFFKGEFSY